MKPILLPLIFLNVITGVSCKKEQVFSADAERQQTVHILDAMTGEPIRGASCYTVFYLGGQTNLSMVATSDSNGVYKYKMGQNGLIGIWISASGYQSSGLKNIVPDTIFLKPYFPIHLMSRQKLANPAFIWGSFTEDGFLLPANVLLDTTLHHHCPDTITIRAISPSFQDTFSFKRFLNSKNQKFYLL